MSNQTTLHKQPTMASLWATYLTTGIPPPPPPPPSRARDALVYVLTEDNKRLQKENKRIKAEKAVVEQVCDMAWRNRDQLANVLESVCSTLPREPPYEEMRRRVEDILLEVCKTQRMIDDLRKRQRMIDLTTPPS